MALIDERIKFRHLQCFLAVARHGSLQKASDVLAITQPAVSKTLKELEGLLGVRLFERGRKGAVLTRAGEAFMRHAGASVQALRDAVESVAPGQRGVLAVSVGVLPTVAPWLMQQVLLVLDRLADQAGRGAGMSLKVHTGANPALLAQLRQRELDLVIGRFAEPAHMLGLTFEHLYADPLVLVVRPGHALLNADVDVLTGLASCTVVLPTAGTAIRYSADNFFSTRGLPPPLRTLETLSVSVSRGYTVASDAVWITPLGAVRNDLSSGVLRPLPVDMAGTEELVGLTLRADSAPNEAQREIIAAIRLVASQRPG
jgi:LysR family transcriptional regulator, pca operon transcriptional activator